MGKRKDVQDQADDAVPAAGESTPTPPEAASEVQAASVETPPAEAIKIGPIMPDSAPIELPLVESPKLDGSEAVADASAEAAAIPAPEIHRRGRGPRQRHADRRVSPCWQPRLRLWRRRAPLSGSLGAMGVAHLFPRNAAPVVANNNHGTAQIAAEMNALKANIDAAARNANSQFAKIADRIDRAERAQADPAAKIAPHRGNARPSGKTHRRRGRAGDDRLDRHPVVRRRRSRSWPTGCSKAG